MVYHNTITSSVDPNYSNEMFRSRHHFKELHQHDPPFRRNRDFKPMTYGAYIGIPNFRHSEPYSMLKNIKDLANEEHNHPIKWTKSFLQGALVGGIGGLLWVVGGPQGPFELNKLMASGGNRFFSGVQLRLMKNMIGPYCMYGGMAMFGYHFIRDYIRHHDETNPRNMIIDHGIALTSIATIAAIMKPMRPWNVFCTAFFTAMIATPLTWFIKNNLENMGHRSANIFYENNVSKDEVERIRMEDEIENMGWQL
jgi:hypothetical protein